VHSFRYMHRYTPNADLVPHIRKQHIHLLVAKDLNFEYYRLRVFIDRCSRSPTM
jgi:hypothetical protein